MSTVNFARILPIAIATTALLSAPASTLARPLTDAPVMSSASLYLAQAEAPIGTYTAEQGTVKTTGRISRRSGSGSSGTVSKRRRNPDSATTSSSTTTTTPLTVVVNSFSTSSELQAISAAGTGNLSAALSSYNHGSVTLNGSTYPIQMATYRMTQGNYVLQLVSAAPFSQTGNQGQTTAGNTVSMVELTIPTAGGVGTGAYYQSVQLNTSQSGQVMAQAGGSAATELTNVQKQ